VFLLDGSPAPMQAASKGKTAKKKIKGEEGKLFVIYFLTDYCCK